VGMGWLKAEYIDDNHFEMHLNSVV